MSNINDQKDNDLEDDLDKDPILDAAGDLRQDNFTETIVQGANKFPFVKPVLRTGNTTSGPMKELEGVFTPEQVVTLSKVIEEETRKKVAASRFDPSLAGQVILKELVPITDFSNLTMDAVYDLSIPIEAKEFFSADALTIKLADTNYEARWVNKNPRNLGDKIAKGFTYIVDQDLQKGTVEAIKASKDSQGHFVFDDVVAMKIDKATYYAALRKAHLRAIATTNEVTARERAAKSANAYMQQSDVGSDFRSAAAQRKIVFYDPNIGV